MRGTQRVSSLLRLILSAAFLCAAWVLLSSTQAEAAERPAPVEVIGSVVAPVSNSVAGTAPVPAVAPSTAAVLKDPVAAVSRKPAPLVAPVVEELRVTAAASVDAGAAGLKTVAAAVPVLEAPVVVVADEVVALADALPLVGRDPLVTLPLPRLPGAPLPDPLAELDLVPVDTSEKPAGSVAKRQDSSSLAAPVIDRHGLALATFDPDVRRAGTGSWPVAERTPRGTGVPDPSGLPGPWPSPQSPMPPTQSVPSPGGGASSGDLASIDPAIALPSPTMWACGTSDWRIPRGLLARPGSRPD